MAWKTAYGGSEAAEQMPNAYNQAEVGLERTVVVESRKRIFVGCMRLFEMYS
ncbi:hypothetical protein GCM10027046_34290 [Uliginosibacterium flavum]